MGTKLLTLWLPKSHLSPWFLMPFNYVIFSSLPLPDLLSLTNGDHSHDNWGSSRTNHWSPSHPHFQMQSGMGHHKKCSCHRTTPPLPRQIIVSVTQRQETKNICEEVGIIFLKTELRKVSTTEHKIISELHNNQGKRWNMISKLSSSDFNDMN